MKNWVNFIILFSIFLIELTGCEKTFDVTKYGADSTGVNKSTSAIIITINEAVKTGGGTVFFPSGKYLTGPIHLKSNITLHFADKSVVKFTSDFDDYLPMVHIRWEGTFLKTFSPLIYGENISNIAIIGNAVLDGNGKVWWDERNKLQKIYDTTKERPSKWQKDFLTVNNMDELVKQLDDPSRIKLGFLRPPFIQVIGSKNILIENVTVKDSPFWNINPVMSEDITISGISVEAPHSAGNTDAIDPDSCKNVLIKNSRFDVGDDCVVIKSGRDLQGRSIGRPSENIVVKDCLMLRGNGGVAIGSEQSGGVRNVSVSNCIFNGTDRAIYLKSTRGRGGIVEDIRVVNATLINVRKYAIVMDLFYTGYNTKTVPFSEKTPVFRKISISHMKGTANSSVELRGLPESPLEDIVLSNINITSKTGFTELNTKNLNVNEFTNRLVN